MKGSRIADEIIQDWKREYYFKKKAIRNECIVNKKKQCKECRYQDICLESEREV